ncbi:MAG TPA: DHHA1 domain-containing protein [Negativicutes bacterium]|nr:DHHA1 domain-containing protein [Negativicutes bacterium]
MQTEKLYYHDPYLKEFTATILTKSALPDGQYAITLDRTAFYPEGGGQPCDTGTLNEAPVLSVQTRNGDIIHTVAGDPGEGTVTGRLDWRRRFDHMQQHTGEHILSGIFLSTLQAENVGFHLSAATCQIDVTLPSLSSEQACAVEDAANSVIFGNRPIDARFVENSELSAYVLRKEPGPEFEQIRLVSIDDCDCCPCGGTHVGHTGEVGLLKIRGWEKRKNNIRVEFVCGGRALADYRLKHEIARTLAARFSAPIDAVLPAFEKNLEKQETVQRELNATRKAYHEELAARLLLEAVPIGAVRIVSREFSGYSAADLQDFAGRMTAVAGGVCLLASIDETGSRTSFLFAAASGVPKSMNDILKRALAPVGGKGGGNLTCAQGGAPTTDAAGVLATALELLASLT